MTYPTHAGKFITSSTNHQQPQRRSTMKTLIIAAAAALGVALAPAGIADAAPKMCDNHGFGKGQIYKHACASGNGGSAVWVPVYNEDGTPKKVMTEDGLKTVKRCDVRCGGGRHHVETTDPW
ncbi:hypothetical protein VISTA_56 [Mycobacterium phage Vista]|uniref:Uncharacterized protein n=1 Tax=Mycobacterium phage Vista TaxID=1089108 RepID=G8I8M3_9CAUD|nr:hypothetical protein VISTA_56 [Mycobacterium phage Vista]AER49067.1 hypothetical protein VISTA_56 [Mycobacterium phage Vista]